MNEASRKSPTYPRVSLQRAIELTRKIYDSALDSPVETTTILTLMGFQGESGPSRAALATLKQFGLVEGRDQSLRVTPLGQSIVHSMSADEQRKAIVAAADTPQIYQTIKGHFAGRLPSDSVLEAYIVRNHGFSRAGALFLVKILRETENFVGPYRLKSIEDDSEVSSDNEKSPEPSAKDVVAGILPSADYSAKTGERILVRISKDAQAELFLHGKVTYESLEKLLQYIELMKDDFPHEADLHE
jgi:hypothetical protein